MPASNRPRACHRHPPLLPLLALAVGLASSTRAPAQSLDDAAARAYAGRYATDCAGSTALRVARDALVVELRGRTITAGDVQTAYSYFGQQTPPAGFQVALMGTLRGGKELVFMVYRDAQGLYVELEGDPALLSALGATARGKHRDCDAERSRRAGAAARDEARQAAADAKAAAADMSNPLNRPGVKRAYLAALGRSAALHWLAALDGPQSPAQPVEVGGRRYTLVDVCKAHDCYDNSAVMLFPADPGDAIVGYGVDATRPFAVGSAPAATAAAVERLWRDRFRQAR